jgi:hypothetical protein
MISLLDLHARVLFEQMQREAQQQRLAVEAQAGSRPRHALRHTLRRLRALFSVHETTLDSSEPASACAAPGDVAA